MLQDIKKFLNIVGSTTSTDIPSKFKNSEIEDWLKSVGNRDVQIDWSAEVLTIYGAETIENRQKGYSVSNSWEPSWLVIGDVHADPIIYDNSTTPARVFFSRHGQGAWQPEQLADSLQVFSTILEIWCEIYYLQFQQNILDESFEVRSDFLEALSVKLGFTLNEDEMKVLLFAVAG